MMVSNREIRYDRKLQHAPIACSVNCGFEILPLIGDVWQDLKAKFWVKSQFW
jgi:hypothetical protein